LTPATFSKVPRSAARKVGIAPNEVVEVELADGRILEREAAEAQLEFNGRTRTVPLVLGGDDELPLLGLTMLETFRLKVNPVSHRLEPARAIEYSSAS
jgi:predicted aspartyl protease